MDDIRYKKGKIVIDKGFFYEFLSNGIIQLVFAQFIPMHIDDSLYFEQIVYFGFSNKFDSIEEGDEIPEYRVEVEMKARKVRFIRK